MARRYLTISEAETALKSDRSVECFLGYLERKGKHGIHWFSIISLNETGFQIRIYESIDSGSPDFADIYTFAPLDDEIELGAADEIIEASTLQSLWQSLQARFPGCLQRIVNQGMVGEEYFDSRCALGRS